MTSLKCDQPGCDYTARHEKANYVKAMVGRHKRSAHGIVGGYKPKGTGNSQINAPAKRPYTRKQPSANVVNFCPCCGCNLKAVSVAVNMMR